MNNILVIGSANIDRCYSVENIVSPKETVSCSGYSENLGGKGFNQAVAAAKAGGRVFAYYKTNPADSAVFSVALKDAGAKAVFFESEKPTGHAVIQIDKDGQNSIIVYGGANTDFTSEDADAALEAFGEGDFLILQNEINRIPEILENAKAKGLTTVFNPSPFTDDILKMPLVNVDYFIVNELEAALLCGEESIRKIPLAFLKKFPGSKLVLTLGEQGSQFYSQDYVARVNAFPAEAVDTTGAGDCYLGYFTAGICDGMEIREAMLRASKASAICVGRAGAAISVPGREEVEV